MKNNFKRNLAVFIAFTLIVNAIMPSFAFGVEEEVLYSNVEGALVNTTLEGHEAFEKAGDTSNYAIALEVEDKDAYITELQLFGPDTLFFSPTLQIVGIVEDSETPYYATETMDPLLIDKVDGRRMYTFNLKIELEPGEYLFYFSVIDTGLSATFNPREAHVVILGEGADLISQSSVEAFKDAEAIAEDSYVPDTGNMFNTEDVIFSNIRDAYINMPSDKSQVIESIYSYDGEPLGVPIYLDETTYISEIRYYTELTEYFYKYNSFHIYKESDEGGSFEWFDMNSNSSPDSDTEYEGGTELEFEVDIELDPGYYFFGILTDSSVEKSDMKMQILGETSGEVTYRTIDEQNEILRQKAEEEARLEAEKDLIKFDEIVYTSNNVIYDSGYDDNFRGDIGNNYYEKEEYRALFLVEDSATIQDLIFTTGFTGKGHMDYSDQEREKVDVPENLMIEIRKHTSVSGTELVGYYDAKLYESPSVDPFYYTNYGQLLGATAMNLTLGRGVYVARVIPNEDFKYLASVSSDEDRNNYLYDQETFDFAMTGTKTTNVITIPDGDGDVVQDIIIEGIVSGLSISQINSNLDSTMKAAIELQIQQQKEAAERAAKEAEAAAKALAEKPITLKVNGVVLNPPVPPVVQNGTTLAPVRAIVESLGKTVVWNNSEQRVDIYDPLLDDKLQIQMYIGNNIAKVNTNITYGLMSDVYMQIPPQIINGSTMLPVRFLAENLGFTVEWDQNTKTVNITSGAEG